MRSRPGTGTWAARLGVLLLLLALTAAAHYRQRTALEASRAGARAALTSVLSTGEVVGATLLGGFRSIAINMVWVRLLARLEEQRYDELPGAYAALEVLQGDSPAFFIRIADQMVLDIPHHLPHRPDERWTWIVRGLEALERGRRLFPRSIPLLREAAYLYYERFHPLRSPADRQRFMASARRPGGLLAFGSDPLSIAREAAERALEEPGHPFDVDGLLWPIYRFSYAAAAGGAGGGLSAAELLGRAKRLYLHAREVHGGEADIAVFLNQWQAQLEEGLKPNR